MRGAKNGTNAKTQCTPHPISSQFSHSTPAPSLFFSKDKKLKHIKIILIILFNVYSIKLCILRRNIGRFYGILTFNVAFLGVWREANAVVLSVDDLQYIHQLPTPLPSHLNYQTQNKMRPIYERGFLYT